MPHSNATMLLVAMHMYDQPFCQVWSTNKKMEHAVRMWRREYYYSQGFRTRQGERRMDFFRFSINWFHEFQLCWNVWCVLSSYLNVCVHITWYWHVHIMRAVLCGYERCTARMRWRREKQGWILALRHNKVSGRNIARLCLGFWTSLRWENQILSLKVLNFTCYDYNGN